MEAFFNSFGLSYAEELLPFYREAEALLSERGEDILAFERYAAFPSLGEELARLRDRLRGDTDALLYCYLLSHLLKKGEDKRACSLARPHSFRSAELDDLLPLFPLLDQTESMLALHRELGIPEEVSRDTVLMFENQVQDFMLLYHHPGISVYFSWMLSFLRGHIYRIGRFNLERMVYRHPYEVFRRGDTLCILANGGLFHKSGQVLGSVGCEETEGSFAGDFLEDEDAYEGFLVQNGLLTRERVRLSKAEWTRVLTAGDPLISVHIPSGGPMPPEVCERDLMRGKELLDRALGEHRGFYCNSWILDSMIKALLPAPTNLTRFADRFVRFPLKSGGDGVFAYVWNKAAPCPPETLTADTTLTRVLRDYLLSGHHIYGAGGVIL